MERKRPSETVGDAMAMAKRQKTATPSPEEIAKILEQKKKELAQRLQQAQMAKAAATGTAASASSSATAAAAASEQQARLDALKSSLAATFNAQQMPVGEARGGLKVSLHPSLAALNRDDGRPADLARAPIVPRAPFATTKANQRAAAAAAAASSSSSVLQPAPRAGALTPPVDPAATPKQPQLQLLPRPPVDRDNPYFDPSIKAPPRYRTRNKFRFVKSGKYVKQAEQLRAKEKLEMLQARIAETVKKSGMEANLELVTDKTVKREAPPLVEWWDQPLLYGAKSYEELPLDTATLDFAEPISISDGSTDKIAPVTSLVMHPLPLPPSFGNAPVAPRPLMLTKTERKKLRRQRRMEAQRERQDKIKLGLLPTPQPKVRIANLMRVLQNDAVQDPTKVEREVRKQVEKRRLDHERANQERALTAEQKRERREQKQKEDAAKGIYAAVFKCTNINHPKLKFKIDTNAQQYNLTGVAIVHRDCNLVVVEGGPSSLKHYKKLMLRRIKWDEILRERAHNAAATAATADATGSASNGVADMDVVHSDDDEDDDDDDRPENRRCWLIWEGQVPKRAFQGFRFRVCPLEKQVGETLSKHGVEHYWDLAKNWNASEVHRV
ncbi:U4/U5/U6 small nuclear ribonucleoprotein prp3 [Sorochytrium milnesiophthora]